MVDEDNLSTMTSKTDPNNAESDAQKAEEKASKEELVEAKMRIIRKKNEDLMRRQKEIEEDRKNADVYSKLVEIKKQHGSGTSGVNKDSSQPGGVAGRGRGRGRGLMLQEMRKETLKAKQWEAKRKENVVKEEQERKQGSRNPNSASRFLMDDKRVDMSRMTGRNEHSWGGANFNKVTSRMQREKEGFRPGRNRDNMEMTMSGKERQQYREWKDERKKIDEERKARQKKAGNWSRTWDQKKVWDARRKMWVFEEFGDNGRNMRHHDGHGRAEDWGIDSRGNNYLRENRGQNRGHYKGGGFRQYDNHETRASEMQRGSSQSEVLEKKSTTSKTETETRARHNQDGTVNGEGTGEENWDEEPTVPLHQKKEEESLDAVIETSTDNSQRIDKPKPQKERKEQRRSDKHGISEDSQKNQQSAAEVTSNKPHSGTSQQELQESLQDDFAVNEDSQVQPESTTTKDSSLSVISALHESPGDKKEAAVECKDQIKNLHEESEGARVNLEDVETGERANDIITTDSDKDKQECSPQNPAHEKQDVSIDHSAQQEHRDDSANSVHNDTMLAETANLPKLKTDKKVSDTKENNQEMKSDTEVASVIQASASDADTPPTPDFLKLEQDLDWGEIEIDEEKIVERW